MPKYREIESPTILTSCSIILEWMEYFISIPIYGIFYTQREKMLLSFECRGNCLTMKQSSLIVMHTCITMRRVCFVVMLVVLSSEVRC